MRLRNKKTGEIIELLAKPSFVKRNDDFLQSEVNTFNSLAELNAEWEDYKEPKGIQCIYYVNHFDAAKLDGVIVGFDSKEEAELAVRKLKAWKRLKDKGFRFCGWATNEGIRGVDFEVPDSFFSEHNHSCISDETRNDLDLLFGGEE